MPEVAAASPLFGRERELEHLRGALQRASAGRTSTELIVGEPGIGKTRLAQAFADEASAHGALVAWGRAWEAGGAPPFWPWIEALRGLLERADVPLPDAIGTDRAAALAQLLPELPTPATTAAPLEPDAARFRLFDAVAACLRRISRERPIVIVLDDLHAADVGTLALLHFVARTVRDAKLVLLGTYRDVEARLSEPVGEALAKVAREGRYLSLSRLTRDAVERWVANVAPSSDAALLGALWGRTEGNPLFMVETLRLLRDREVGVRVPDGVREVIRTRLRDLSARAHTFLEAASIFGRRFETSRAAAVCGMELADARDRMAEAVRADVLLPVGPDRAEFTHILLRDALYDELSAARRAELHAAALQVLAPSEATVALAEVVHHAFAAIPVVSALEAIAWARRAASRAIEALAYDDAADWLERAIATLPPGAGHDAERCDLLLALAEAQVGAGRVTRSRESSRAAVVIARARQDPERLAHAALAFGRVYAMAVAGGELVALLEEALATLPEDASPLRASLLARLASALQPAHDPEEPMAIARRAIAMSRSVADAATHLDVLVGAGSALGYFADPEERAALSQELIEIADKRNDRVRALRGRARLAIDHVELGRVADADACITEYERLATSIELPSFRWVGCTMRAMLAMLQGRFSAAEEKIEEAGALAATIDDGNAPLRLGLQRVALLRASARDLERERIVPVALERVMAVTDRWYARSFAAVVLAGAGRSAESRAMLGLLAQDVDTLRGRAMLAWVAEACVAMRDLQLAERILEPLAALARRNHSWGMPAMVCEGPITHALGGLEALLGRHDDAVHHLLDAHARADAMHALPARTRIELDLAAVLAIRDAKGDREQARRRLDAAAETARALPMPGLFARIDALASSIAADRSAKPEPVAKLPDAPAFAMRREGEVWAIVGDGEFRLKDSRGLRILARLVDHPGVEFHVTDLLAPPGEAGHVADSGDAIDATAIAKYRERLGDLRDQQREAEDFGDATRAERLQVEIEALASELARGVGLGGRARKAGSTSEKARINVRQRLRDAIEKVAEHSPSLGKHLRWAVRTGTFCSYDPSGR